MYKFTFNIFFCLDFLAQERLAELQAEVVDAEQRVLKATEKLKQVQEAAVQRQVSIGNQECTLEGGSCDALLDHHMA